MQKDGDEALKGKKLEMGKAVQAHSKDRLAKYTLSSTDNYHPQMLTGL